ncbi:MAG: hypothetical protein IJU23_07405 [Proteobacteria bacterium]|nr:hypothetical protein [Pseudomonadota bacterium]
MNIQKKRAIICLLSALGLSLAACSEPVEADPCDYSSDCDDNMVCRNKICVPDPCIDGRISEGESDIDCGHVCNERCDAGLKCLIDDDCKSGVCSDGKCIDPEKGCTKAETGDLLMTEILNNVSTGKTFDNIGDKQTEFFEIYNTSQKKIGLSALSIQCTRTDDGSNKTVLFDKFAMGCLEPHNAALVSNTAIADVPEGVINIKGLSAPGQLINTATYSCVLIQNSINANGGSVQTPLHTVIIDGTAGAGVSEVLDPIKYTTASQPMKLHTEVSERGAKHSPGYCTNGALFINQCLSTCENGKADPGETDVDCGGNLCTPCATGLHCATNDDCISKLCTASVCEAQSCAISGCPEGYTCDIASGDCYSCSDNKKNGDETDVDCGGTECGRCRQGLGCRDDNDCESMSCQSGHCVGEPIDCQSAHSGDILLTEVMNNAATAKDMATFRPGSGQKQVEFFELYNASEHAVSLDDLSINLTRLDKSGNASFALRGCLKAGQSAVVSGTKMAGLPDSVFNLVLASMPANSLTNTATYQYSLATPTETIHTIHDGAAAKEGISRIIPTLDGGDDDQLLSNHDEINAALKHSPGYCTNGTLYENGCENLCENGKLDAGETGVDCGGACAPCAVGQGCSYDSDCASNVCSDTTCAQPKCTDNTSCQNGWCNKSTGDCETCYDGIQNGGEDGETDVDCGGTVCTACDAGKKCQANIDCLSYHCESFVCTGDPVESIKPNEIVINEVMGAPKTSAKFSTQPESSQCEFVEIVSIANTYRNLNGWSLMYKRADTDTVASVPLSNLIAPKHGIVLNNCSTLPLPSNMRSQTIEPNAFVNSADYDLWLSDGEHLTDIVTRKGLSSATGVSQTRTVELDSTAELAFHNKVYSKYSNSPGYCANGGLFTEDCETECTNGHLDTGESDVDCGGSCSGCQIGQKCVEGTDCESGYCRNKQCVMPPCKADSDCEDGASCDTGSGLCISCSDNAKNGSETDVDCGGSCGGCAAGKACLVYSDCISGLCEQSVCKSTSAVSAKPGDLIVNEILDSSTKSPAFSLNNGVAACEFIEIANPTTKDLNLYGLTLTLNAVNGSGASQKPVLIPLHGVLKSKNLLVVNNCESLPLPDDAVSFKVDNGKILTGTWTYTISLDSSTESSDQIKSLSIGSVVNSSYNRNPDMTAGASMVKTTSMDGYAAFATPGYCANGALYSDGCKVHCENGRKDQDETDVDCGGSCGGCANNKYCKQNSDCQSDLCSGGRCTGEIAVTPVPTDLVINEVMAAKGSGKVFALNGNVATCEFIEVVNVSGKKLNLSGVQIKGTQHTTTGDTTKDVVLSGILESKGVIVAHNCETLPLLQSTVEVKLNNNFLTDSATFDFWIDVNGTTGSNVSVSKATSGVSMNRAADLDSTTVIGTKHTTLNSAAVASPGYCANGKLFSAGCK